MSDLTNEEIVDLGRRAVECSAWRWLPGMMDLYGGDRVLCIGADGSVWTSELEDSTGWEGGYSGHKRYRDDAGFTERDNIPDLSDPATKWLVLELVRERVPGAYVNPIRGSGVLYAVVDERGRGLMEDWEFHPTEAHALVAALEAVSR